jgi:hypothetical protein
MTDTDNEDPAMNVRTIRRLSILSAALLLFAAPAAHAQTPPAGDNHLSPVTVKLNGSTTVTNVQFATLESALVEAVTCDGNASSDNSVWFQFTLPSSGTVDIDAGGSLLDTGTGTNSQVVMTLYEPDGVGLTETVCLFDNKPRMTDVGLNAGTHVVRLASDMTVMPQALSQYRLSVRVRYMSQILADPEFDQPLGTVWKIKNAGDPSLITQTCTSYCYIYFNGIAGGTLQQTILIDPSVMKFKVGDYFGASLYIMGTPVSGADIKMTVKLIYSDGTPPTKVTLVEHVTETSTTLYYSGAGGFAVEIRSKALKSIKFKVTSPTTADTFRIINSILSLSAGTSVRAPLPVPPSP